MGPHDDDGSGVTLAVALRAEPAYPATAAATAAATPSANSENFLLNAPSSIVRPENTRTTGSSFACLTLSCVRGVFRAPPRVSREVGEAFGAYNGPAARRWRNWSTRWPQKPLSFGTCGFESHPPHESRITVDYRREAC